MEAWITLALPFLITVGTLAAIFRPRQAPELVTATGTVRAQLRANLRMARGLLDLGQYPAARHILSETERLLEGL